MSKIQPYNIPCPKCKTTSEYKIFHSINTSFPNAVLKILGDEINFAHCPNCGNKFQVKTGFLFNHIEKKYALYYNPTSFEQMDEECANIKKMLGQNFYLSNPLKFKDWELFKTELRNKEGIVPQKSPTPKRSNISVRSYDSYWSCDICDGNAETGCLYFDPTECPRH